MPLSPLYLTHKPWFCFYPTFKLGCHFPPLPYPRTMFSLLPYFQVRMPLDPLYLTHEPCFCSFPTVSVKTTFAPSWFGHLHSQGRVSFPSPRRNYRRFNGINPTINKQQSRVKMVFLCISTCNCQGLKWCCVFYGISTCSSSVYNRF